MATSKAGARAALGAAAHTEVDAKRARFQLLKCHTRNKEGNSIGADIPALRQSALHQVGDVVAVSEAGGCGTSREAEIRRKSIGLKVRDAPRRQGDISVKQEVAAVQLKAITSICGIGDHYATRTLS